MDQHTESGQQEAWDALQRDAEKGTLTGAAFAERLADAFTEQHKAILVAPWFWRPFTKLKWGIIIAIGAWFAYQRVSEGASTGSAAALFLMGWLIYAATYGFAGIVTSLYVSNVIRKRDPERYDALNETGVQGLIGPDRPGLAWGLIALIILIVALAIFHGRLA